MRKMKSILSKKGNDKRIWRTPIAAGNYFTEVACRANDRWFCNLFAICIQFVFKIYPKAWRNLKVKTRKESSLNQEYHSYFFKIF